MAHLHASFLIVQDEKMEPKEEPIDAFHDGNEVDNGRHSPKMEPKEELLDDFLLMAAENEFLGAVDQSENDDISPLSLVEPKTEVIEDTVGFAVENVLNLPPHPSDFPVRYEPVDEYMQDLITPYQVASSVQCILCEVYLKTAYDYISHLLKQHNSSLTANDRYLRCCCGFEFRYSKWYGVHLKNCNGRAFTVHILEQKSYSTPKCILSHCDAYPATAAAYILHLQMKHITTLIVKGIYLRCSCGLQINSRNDTRNHNKMCDGRTFSLHQLMKNDREIPARNVALDQSARFNITNKTGRGNQGIVKCVMCEIHPLNVYQYVEHLNKRHKSTLEENLIYLRCSCGYKVRRSNNHFLRITDDSLVYLKKCAGLSFTLHYLRSPLHVRPKVHPTPQRVVSPVPILGTSPKCILCYMHPQTVQEYIGHLQVYHKTTLRENNIYLKCSCEMDYRYAALGYNNKHDTQCKSLNFTLHKMEKNVAKGADVPLSLCEEEKSMIPAWDAVLDQSTRCEMSTVFPMKSNSEVAVVEAEEEATPQCFLCEEYPTTAYAYAYHLTSHHKLSLITSGISLVCYCGNVMRSHNRHYVRKNPTKSVRFTRYHYNQCDGRQFTCSCEK